MAEQTGLAVKQNGTGIITQAQKVELRATLKEMVVGGRKLTDEQIDGRMAFAIEQGLDPISEVHTLVDNNGKTMAHTMAVNGLRRKNQEELGDRTQTVDLEFIAIEKMELAWAYAYTCRLRDSISYRNWQKRILELGKVLKEVLGTLDYGTLIEACGPAPITEGIGIVYKTELNEWKDRNFNPMERAKKRAEVNARHHRFSTNTPVYDGDNNMPIEGEGMIEGSFSVEPVKQQQIEAPKRNAAQINDELGFGSDPVKPEPSIIEPEQEPEPELFGTGETASEQEAAEVIPPTEVMAAMLFRVGDTKMVDMDLDALKKLANSKTAAKVVKDNAALMLNWKEQAA